MEAPLLYNTWNPERFEWLKHNEGEGDFVSRTLSQALLNSVYKGTLKV